MLECIFYSFRTYIHEYPILFPYMWFVFFWPPAIKHNGTSPHLTLPVGTVDGQNPALLGRCFIIKLSHDIFTDIYSGA